MSFLGISDPLIIGMAVASVSALGFYIAFAAGQLNVSQTGFMAIGAYSVAMTTTKGLSITLGVLIGIAISSALGALLSAITSRLSGVYLAIATLAFVTVVQQAIYITPFLKGPMGIFGIPLALNAWQSVAILVVVAFVVSRLMASRLGYEMRILREDPIVARGVGVNEIRIRIFTGAASAVLASIAGNMLALTTSYIAPEEFGFHRLIDILSFGVVGGTDRFWGPIVGAGFLTLLPEYTRWLQEYRMVLTGVIIVGVVVLFPEGIAGGVTRLWVRLRPQRSNQDLSSIGDARQETDAVSDTRGNAAASGKVLCSASNLQKHFGGVTAVDDISLDLTAGVVQGLIGPNGAGKSTLVDLLSGEQRTSTGRILVESEDITPLPAYTRARLGVVRTYQHSRITQSITAQEVVFSGCLLASRPSSLGYMLALPSSRRVYRDATEKAESILRTLGLGEVASRYVRDLGWEEQRRLEIARAIALRPKVLLLDEPTAGMHADSLPAFSRLLRTLASDGTAVLLIEHNVAFIRSTVDTLYAMDSGKMIAHGEPGEVLANPFVVDSYLGARST
ncbi:branched-chain amino acid ABC transporter ATP-binding protein/permease [Marivibrio halodurans]|uniref:Branched-chain amino acid ABC transporter ATP-binding protein/permease n=1 Tax=Marivibrio halodurans TaxID=2039722 RepID=A0A8J7S2B9_9PROT|nr:branched-chain amino acid ABC transporter ATP-binding protein/permease [Marivibrio halodurans]MBP5858550.1 branched-chain amino acid ABC transporter ATP-binding protein/permease [Marivibrio halodurans]